MSTPSELADAVIHASEDVTCPLCFASFNSGRAYAAHFRKAEPHARRAGCA
jgi:hypothetical protein